MSAFTFLRQNRDCLGVDARLALIRQIAEALKYAHGKAVVHRGLSPQCILVWDGEPTRPTIKIMNWQVGRRSNDGATTESMNSSITIHPDQLMEETALLYIAPEALRSPDTVDPGIDVFSLGAIAYHFFTGEAPAASVMDLLEKLNRDQDLDMATVITRK